MKRLLLLAALTSLWAYADFTPNQIAVLCTDYGADSIYVGILKGAMLSKDSTVRIVDLTNSVPPFDIVAGAYMLAEGCAAFPPGATFCVVIDPGVGTPRKRIVLETKNGYRFVAPDNGVLTLVAEQFGVAALRECANPEYWRNGALSSTFHGRDIFGPVAAALACGAPLEDVGPELTEMVKIDLKPAAIHEGAVHGFVMRADPYGNLITNIPRTLLAELGVAKGDVVEARVGAAAPFRAPFVTTYGDVGKGEYALVLQSSGFVELAINLGNLAETLGEREQAAVVLRKAGAR